MSWLSTGVLACLVMVPLEAGAVYQPRGFGGGGAFASYSISPYDPDLRLVGTDMGQFYRTTDGGVRWTMINHAQSIFSADLDNAAQFGFSADKRTVFHAYAGCLPQRSTDRGRTWTVMQSLENLLPKDENGPDVWRGQSCIQQPGQDRIKYWVSDPNNADRIFAATGEYLYVTTDRGDSWSRVPGVTGFARGTFMDVSTTPYTIYHAVSTGIYRSLDGGATFSLWKTVDLIGFAAGRDAHGLTLAYLDTDTSACTANGISLSGSGVQCGYLWTGDGGSTTFTRKPMFGGDFVKMADNDSRTIYTTAHESWDFPTGTIVYVSTDGGNSYARKFQQCDYAYGGHWIPGRIELSAVGLDVGYWDDGYYNFTVHRYNSALAGGTGQFFLHTTADRGEHWASPFTSFADTGDRDVNKRWRSTGLEVTSAHTLKFHPNDPNLGYVGFADIGGAVTEDGGDTWRITRPGDFNATYDFAFDAANQNVAYAASSTRHDWPYEWYKMVMVNSSGCYHDREPYCSWGGGVFKTTDRGMTWTRLTPADYEWGMPFLSVAYDSRHNILYAGSQGRGVARSTDGGATWTWFNDGLGTLEKIVPQVEIDPVNQDVYLLLTGNYADHGGALEPSVTNTADIGVYRLPFGQTTWQRLRGTVHRPPGVDPQYTLWEYPVHFTMDWHDAARQTIWLTDLRVYGYESTGVWKTTDGGSNWHRKLYQVDPHRVTIHPNDPNKVYVAGRTDASDYGHPNPVTGAMYSTDGGTTWHEDSGMPNRYTSNAVTFDPSDVTRVFYTTHGAGLFYGVDPALGDCNAPLGLDAIIVILQILDGATPATTCPLSMYDTSGNGTVGMEDLLPILRSTAYP